MRRRTKAEFLWALRCRAAYARATQVTIMVRPEIVTEARRFLQTLHAPERTPVRSVASPPSPHWRLR